MEPVVIDNALERVRAALLAGKLDDAIGVLADLHPADRAEAFSDLARDDQEEILPRLDPEDAAELLEELEDDEAAEAAASLAPGALADVLDEMEPDAAADILGDLSPEQAASALAQMESGPADEVRPLLAYADDTAGGLMTPEFFALRGPMTAHQAIQFLRERGMDASTPYYLYVVDRADALIGVVGLRDLILAEPQATLESIMHREVRSVLAGTDQEEVARIFKRYGLLTLPVVDAGNRLVGLIRSSDIVYVIEEEATEDFYHLANLSADERAFSPLLDSVRRRLPWLVINLGTAFLAAWVVSLFQTAIAQVAVLAALQSIVSGQGGNSATQTLTVIVRSVALGEVELRDAWRAMIREAGLGVLNGAAIGIIVGACTWLWQGRLALGLIMCAAMIGNMVAGGLAGALVPLTLKALRQDPALASAVLVTTVTDCVGFALFLGLATAFLPYLV